MLRFFIVKDILLLPVRYLIVFLVSGLLIFGLVFMALWGGTYDPSSGSTTMSLAYLLSLAPAPAVLGAVYVAGMYLLFTLLKKKARRAVGILVVSLTGFTILSIGGVLLSGLPDAPAELMRPLPVSAIVNTDTYSVHTETRQGLEYRQVLVYDVNARPGFSLVDEALREPAGNGLAVPQTGIELQIDRARNSPWRILDLPVLVADLVEDIDAYTEAWLGAARSNVLLFFVLSAVSAFFVASLWPLARVTRWPLFNALIVFGAVRLLFVIAGLTRNGDFVRVFADLVSQQAVPWILPASLLFVAALFFALLALMQPFDQWRREVDAS